MNIRTILNTISFIILFTAFILVCLVFYWLVYPYKVIEIKDPIFPVMNKVVKQGTILIFTSNNCKYMNIIAKTSRIFVDDLMHYVPQTTSNVRKGCGKINISVIVPETLPSGKYHLQNIYEYKVNPIRTITIIKDTEEFLVVE